jgi:2,3-bisphosphoglycerate-dependent phosphoglycerate mutase
MDARRAARLLGGIPVDLIISSPYRRAVQTVEGIAAERGLPITQYEELLERPIKGLDYSAAEEELLAGIRQSFEDKDYCMAGGESTRRAQERSIPLLLNLIRENEGKTIVIGTHGNIMTIMLNYFDEGIGYDFWQSTSKPDIYHMVMEKERLVELNRVWNESDH